MQQVEIQAAPLEMLGMLLTPGRSDRLMSEAIRGVRRPGRCRGALRLPRRVGGTARSGTKAVPSGEHPDGRHRRERNHRQRVAATRHATAFMPTSLKTSPA